MEGERERAVNMRYYLIYSFYADWKTHDRLSDWSGIYLVLAFYLADTQLNISFTVLLLATWISSPLDALSSRYSGQNGRRRRRRRTFTSATSPSQSQLVLFYISEWGANTNVGIFPLSSEVNEKYVGKHTLQGNIIFFENKYERNENKKKVVKYQEILNQDIFRF